MTPKNSFGLTGRHGFAMIFRAPEFGTGTGQARTSEFAGTDLGHAADVGLGSNDGEIRTAAADDAKVTAA